MAGNLAPILEAFQWGAGGGRLSPEEVARRREIAMSLLQRGSDTSPVGHWSAGAARLVDALSGGIQHVRAERADRRGQDARAAAMSQITDLLFPQAAAAPLAAMPPQTAAPAQPPVPNGMAPVAPVEQAALPPIVNDPFTGGAPMPEPMAAPAPAPAPAAAAFPQSLIASESGGDWRAQNQEVGSGGVPGHYGRLQFGNARLQDAMRAGVIPQGMTPQQFMADPAAQQAVEQWHFADIDRAIARNGLDQYYGQTVGGVPITQDALRAMAHLGGIGGMTQFVQTGGQYNPSDAYGTSLSDYGLQHGGGGGASPVAAALGGGQQQAMAAAAPNPVVEALVGGGAPRATGGASGTPGGLDMRALISTLLADPYTAQMGEALVMQQLQQRMTPQSPVDLQSVEGPDGIYTFNPRTGEVQRAMGFPEAAPDQTSQIQNLIAAGLQPGTPEFQQQMLSILGPSRTEVNVGPTGIDYGDPPTSHAWARNPDGTVRQDDRGAPIALPVGPALTEQQAAEQAAAGRTGSQQQVADTMTSTVDRALSILDSNPGLTAGLGGSIASRIPGTPATDLSSLIDTLRANLSFDRLQEMRDNSPTGGALGSITEGELRLLGSTVASLGQNQSPGQLRENLQLIRQLYASVTAALNGQAPINPTGPTVPLPPASAGGANGFRILSVE